VDAANDLAFLEAQDDLRKPSKTSTGSQTAILPLRLRASGLGLRCKRRLKSAAGGARKVLHLPGKADWI